MATAKISAPVGLQPRRSEGKPVKNVGKDVVLIRQMLSVNLKAKLGESKSVDAGLLKAISNYQKKIGFKKPDQVIDPDGRTIKSLAPKFEAYLKEVEKEEEITLVEVKYRGKILQITPQDHKKLCEEVFKKLESYMNSLIRNHKYNMDVYQDYLNTAMLKDGLMNAVVNAIIIKAGSVKMPEQKLVNASIRATGALERAVASKSLAKLDTALPEAEKAINAFSADVRRFLVEFTGAAQTTGTVCQVASAASFAVVGALAAPVVVTATGMSAAAAAVTTGAGVGVLQSASQELAKHASGQKLTVWDSVKAIAIDGTIGGLTGGIGNKIPLGFCDDMAKAVAPRIASRIGFATAKEMEKYIANYLAGAGQEAIKSAINQSITLIGNMAKSGKVPTKKDFENEVYALLISTLTGGLAKTSKASTRSGLSGTEVSCKVKFFPMPIPN